MGFKQINFGILLDLPTKGTTNWADQLESTTWTKISNHRHTGGGDGNLIPSSALAANYGWTQGTTLTPTGTTEAISFNTGNVQVIDLGGASGNVTLTLSDPVVGALYTVFIIQGATPWDVIWEPAANIKWPGGQKPIVSLTDDAVDKVMLYYDGTNYFGDWDIDYL